jgi:hypothetical protein
MMMGSHTVASNLVNSTYRSAVAGASVRPNFAVKP